MPSTGNWLAGPCLNDAFGASLHVDQLLQDLLTFELFWFFHYIFSFFFTVLVVHPHRDHPITKCLNTLHSPMARYSLAVLKVSLNTNQTNKH